MYTEQRLNDLLGERWDMRAESGCHNFYDWICCTKISGTNRRHRPPQATLQVKGSFCGRALKRNKQSLVKKCKGILGNP